MEEFLSSPDLPAALWRRLLGHLSSLTLLVKGGTFETGCFASLGILCVRRTFYGGLGRLNNERA